MKPASTQRKEQMGCGQFHIFNKKAETESSKGSVANGTAEEMDDKKMRVSHLSTILFAVTLLCSTVVLGNIAEMCDHGNTCSARLITVITFDALATLFSAITLTAALLSIQPLLSLEWLLVMMCFVCHAVSVALISSVRTALGNVVAVTFSWIGLVVAFVAMLISARMAHSPCFKRVDADLQHMRNAAAIPQDPIVPEDNYISTVSSVPECDTHARVKAENGGDPSHIEDGVVTVVITPRADRAPEEAKGGPFSVVPVVPLPPSQPVESVK